MSNGEEKKVVEDPNESDIPDQLRMCIGSRHYFQLMIEEPREVIVPRCITCKSHGHPDYVADFVMIPESHP